MKKLLSLLLVLVLLLSLAPLSLAAENEGIEAVLDGLGKASYREAYEALLLGEVIEKGTNSDSVKALQRLLNELGQEVSKDGKAGSGTIKAVNKILAKYGMEETEVVDADVFAELLCCAYILEKGEDAQEDVITAGMDEGQYYYILGRKYQADKHYYLAQNAYTISDWADWSDRADDCVQKWPSDGRIWKSNSRIGSGVTVKFKVTNSDSDVATCFKIYNSDDKLVAVLFIGGNGSASTNLKAGRYTIKKGTGTDWYGRKDCFGEAGWYSTLTFDDGETSVKLKAGYEYTITSGVSDGNVGSNYEGWGDF